jgi:glycosyltransferase involved in cell wall biosynthesis
MALALGERTSYALESTLFQAADHVICLNNFERRYLMAAHPINQNNISVVPNGVAEEFYHARPELFIERFGLTDFVLFVGSIIERKNPLGLARAVANTPELQAVFIGRPESHDPYVQEFASFLRQQPRIHWLRDIKISDPLLASAYAAAKIFCLPSFHEAQSLAALEAMAAGKPIVLADRAYAYQPPFEQSIKCDPNNARNIALCLERAMNHPSGAAVRLPSSYKWDQIAHSIADIYQKLRS